MRNCHTTFRCSEIKQRTYAILYEQQKKGLLCDYSIQVDEEPIPVHRIVLASAIPFFQHVFTMVDQECEAEIKKAFTGLPLKVSRDIVAYAYTGRITSSCDNNIQHLITAARTFDLPDFLTKCEEFIIKRLSLENISSIWSFAKTMNLNAVLKACRAAVRNNFMDFLETDFFAIMPLCLFEEYLSSDDLHVTNEDVVFEALDLWTRQQKQMNEKTRIGVFEKLFPLVRLSHLSGEFRQHVVPQHPICKASSICRKLVNNFKEETKEPTRTYFRDTSEEHIFVQVNHEPEVLWIDHEEIGRWESINLYNLETNSMTKLVDLEHRFISELVSVDSSVYALGGTFNKPEQNRWCRVDAVTKTINTLAPMKIFHGIADYLVVRGCIVRFACYEGDAEFYNPRNDTWSSCSNIPEERDNCSVVNVDNSYLLLIGGCDKDETPTASIDLMRLVDDVDEFLPASGWLANRMPPLLRPRIKHKSEYWRGRLFVVGGEVAGTMDQSVEMFTSNNDPETNPKHVKWIPEGQWTRVQNIPFFRDIESMFIFKDVLYAVGSNDGTSTNYICRLNASVPGDSLNKEDDASNDTIMLNRGSPFAEFNCDKWEWELVTTYTGANFLSSYGVVNIPASLT